MRMLVLGGDARSAYLAQLAAEEGWDVSTSDDGLLWDAAVLPYPTSFHEGKLCGGEMTAEEVAARIGNVRDVFGGRGAERVRSDAVLFGEDAGFVIENAAITAEGAAFCAMRDSCGTLSGAKCLILGCGRIARFLAQKLDALGATVSIAARKAADRTFVCASGWQAISFDAQALGEALQQADAVFNTVPQCVLDDTLLEMIRKDAWLYELASAPYGFSMARAQEIGLQARLEAGLPGKYAPKAAAAAMLRVINQRVKEENRHA